jgi:C_GCAxxG_C_C family probable redox protein
MMIEISKGNSFAEKQIASLSCSDPINAAAERRILLLADMIATYYSPEHDLNCAEAMLYAANDVYRLGLTRETLHAVAGFGGGMAIEETCGALAGAVAVMGILLVEDRAHESERLKESVKDFFRQYEKQMGTINCKLLKDQYREEDPVKCRVIVREAAKLLEEILADAGIKEKKMLPD